MGQVTEAADVLHGLTPDLDEADRARLRRFIDDILHQLEPTARSAGAAAIAEAYQGFSDEGRRRFLQLLIREFWTDRQRVDKGIVAMRAAGNENVRRDAEQRLRVALSPPATDVLRFFSRGRGGLGSLLDLRADLLQFIAEDPALVALDRELHALLTMIFDVGVLTMEQLSWDSPASLLERLIQHEAVHAIGSWPDLKSRLTSGRFCYALCHPSMVGELLVFLELALTSGIVRSLPELLTKVEPRETPDRPDTAIFYSISTCHAGLAGLNLANSLIKLVIAELRDERPELRQFVTLSPVTGFRHWAEEELGIRKLAEYERSLLLPRRKPLNKSKSDFTLERDEMARGELLGLCALYLTNCYEGRALDPVANFHLSNGAAIGSLNWRADPSRTGVERSLGIMATYIYDSDRTAERSDAYITRGVVSVTQQVRQLLPRRSPSRSRT